MITFIFQLNKYTFHLKNNFVLFLQYSLPCLNKIYSNQTNNIYKSKKYLFDRISKKNMFKSNRYFSRCVSMEFLIYIV